MSASPKHTPPRTQSRGLLATLLLLLGSGLLTGCQAVLFPGLNATAGKVDVVVQRDIVYDRTHRRPMILPVVVEV